MWDPQGDARTEREDLTYEDFPGTQFFQSTSTPKKVAASYSMDSGSTTASDPTTPSHSLDNDKANMLALAVLEELAKQCPRNNEAGLFGMATGSSPRKVGDRSRNSPAAGVAYMDQHEGVQADCRYSRGLGAPICCEDSRRVQCSGGMGGPRGGCGSAARDLYSQHAVSNSYKSDPEPALAPLNFEVGSGLRTAMAATCAAPPECKLSFNDGCDTPCYRPPSWNQHAYGVGRGLNSQDIPKRGIGCEASDLPDSWAAANMMRAKSSSQGPGNDAASLSDAPPGLWPWRICLDHEAACPGPLMGGIASAPQGAVTWNGGYMGAGPAAPFSSADSNRMRSTGTGGGQGRGGGGVQALPHGWASSGTLLKGSPHSIGTNSNSYKITQESTSGVGSFEVGSSLRTAVAATFATPPACRLTFKDACDGARSRASTWCASSCDMGNGMSDEGRAWVGSGSEAYDLQSGWTTTDDGCSNHDISDISDRSTPSLPATF